MDTFFRDLRYATRTLIKNPGFAALTIVCLALGIGVNSTIFSAVDTVAMRPLPFRDPDALVALATTHQANGIDRGDVWMFSIFGAIALALASIGVYDVLSCAVSQRTQEIGVRMALGASRQNVVALIVSQGAKLAGIGIVCGIAGAVLVTRVVASLLYNVSATDPLSFVATAGFLALVALLASYIPARRATSVDPIVALRAE